MTPAEILRAKGQMLVDAGRDLIAQADALDVGAAVAVPNDPSSSFLVTLKEAAELLGVKYDALRMRAARAGKSRQWANATYVPRAWVEEQLVRNVRSLSEQSGDVG